jgi:hypothetical protein
LLSAFSFSFFLFGSTRVSIQGFTLARQVFYNLNHASSSFAQVILEMESYFWHRPNWTTILQFYPGMTGTHHYAQLFSIEMGVLLFAQADLELHLPKLGLPSS